MAWIVITSVWYLVLLILGLIFLPLTKKILSPFFDLGYPFSKTLAILALSYLIFVLGFLRILPYSQLSLIFLILVFFVINFYLLKKEKSEEKSKRKNINSLKLPLIVSEEFLFLFSLFFWVFVRGQEPSIRGLEKFMDFGFINSILRAKFFPPLDMWLSGHSINYYYFGHLSGATLIKLINIPPEQGYNLILATLFALGITQAFSLSFNLLYSLSQNLKNSIIAGILGSFLVNLGGNLHTIYAFTKGYPHEQPIPFWQIFSTCNTFFQKNCLEKGINLVSYWYPNATRFIHNTIHEFPSYSYVVADLHGHVFDIPFVLLTLSFLFVFYTKLKSNKISQEKNKKTLDDLSKKAILTNCNQFQLISIIFLGFMIAVHYMTNAFDGPIYLLLSSSVLFFLFGFSIKIIYSLLMIIFSFLIFSFPFSSNFKPFVSGIGVNCGTNLLGFNGKIGPFLFEKGNCQTSPLWMLLVLWGFFWFNFLFYILLIKKFPLIEKKIKDLKINKEVLELIFIFFLVGTILLIIPEFFYIKDIYPAHFRANTMFKLGYQAFIMMSIASSFTFVLFKTLFDRINKISLVYFFLFILQFLLIALYPTFAIPSYYGKLDKKPELDGSLWINYQYPEYKEIIDYLNRNISGQPTILEAQGDSYTDYNVVSAYTGLPTVAGWWVHQWLWRGSASVVGNLIPDIQNIYESYDLNLTKKLISKYKIKYLIIGSNEKNKYKNLNIDKIKKLGKLIFESSNKRGLLIQTQ